jgi:hypothetical protein
MTRAKLETRWRRTWSAPTSESPEAAAAKSSEAASAEAASSERELASCAPHPPPPTPWNASPP